MKTSIKLLTMLLAIVMVLSVMASCGDTSSETTPEETTTSAPETTKTPETTKPVETTKAPDVTADPDATKAPDVTDAPDATDDPDVTKEPDMTDAPDVTEEPETSDDTPEETEPIETDPVNLEDLLPPNVDLGRDMSVFVGNLYYDEWLLDSDEGDIVGTELYNRIPRVEKNLGIELNVELVFGDSGERDTIISEVTKRQESTDPNLIADLCSTYSMFAGNLTLDGRYQNIAYSDNINFESPWWPKDLLENSTIDDKIYFVSGDISPTLIYETYAIFYNIKLLEQYNIQNPIALVNGHEWTIDKLIELTTGIYEDTDTNKKGPSLGDFLAFNFNDNAHMKALPFAMGVRVIIPDVDEGYVWSEDYTGEKMEIIADKVCAWIQSNPGVTTQNDFGNYGTSFKQEQCIFNLGNFAYAAQNLAGSGIDYGVVPCPLYDTEQEEYYSYYGNPTSFWGIPTNASLDDAALLLESLAADAYVYISPALFERALKIKYVTGEVDGLSKMFDIIRDGLVFDASMFYNSKLTGYSGFSELAGDLSSWQSMFNNSQIKRMNRTLTNSVVNVLRGLN